MKKIRLHQFLSKTGIFKSKFDLIEAIEKGEINVRDKTITNSHHQFNPKTDFVFYNGKLLKITKKNIYLLVNKPTSYLSSKLSEKDKKLKKKSIFELIDLDETIKNSLFCVGRLDENSSGLIIITNDGKLSKFIADPENNITKTYIVTLEQQILNKTIEMIQKGITITLEKDGVKTKYKTKKCKIDIVADKKLKITLTEGKKREVRRIFEAVGNNVLTLKRISIGKIKVDKIKEGQYLEVDKEFILKKLN